MVKASKEDPQADVTLVDTLQSLIIAFILAFTFRAFVIEAFVIPTGSMAPTLLGAHAAVTGPDTGYTHTVGPSDEDSSLGGGQAPPVLGTRQAYNVSDPMLESKRAQEVRIANSRTRMGDRIVVLKYLYTLFGPTRYDVVVFKNPTNPSENYIKRLIGLANETIWLADGDVFATKTPEDHESFAIQRKPIHVQRGVWQPVFYSDFVPIDPNRITPRWSPPWRGSTADWKIENSRIYQCTTAQPTALEYQYLHHPITDTTAYNEPREDGKPGFPNYPVSDVRLFGVVKPDQSGLSTTIHLECRDHAFEAKIADGKAVLQMRPLGDENASWTTLDSQSVSGFAPAGQLTQVEFWHADQALYLWINGSLIAQANYDWSPAQRVEFATGLSVDAARQLNQKGNPWHAYDHPPRTASIAWRFAGSPFTLHRVELDRDLFYRPDDDRKTGLPALATHPDYLVSLNKDQFFCCGDNNPASLDGRLWGNPDPWIAAEIDPSPGVVNRALLLGKAFFVYFPSPEGLRENSRRFIPNFGAMRFIH